jgi:hypothetical protein
MKLTSHLHPLLAFMYTLPYLSLVIYGLPILLYPSKDGQQHAMKRQNISPSEKNLGTQFFPLSLDGERRYILRFTGYKHVVF